MYNRMLGCSLGERSTHDIVTAVRCNAMVKRMTSAGYIAMNRILSPL